MKYPQNEKQGLLKIVEHFIYCKGYGSMTQTILSVPPPPPPWEFVKCCVPTVGYVPSKLYTGVREFVIYEFFLFFNFYLKRCATFKSRRGISRYSV